MKLKYLVFLLFILSIFSCQKKESANVSYDSFFDLKDYFEKEQNRLQTVKQISKSVSIDGKVEERVFEDFDLTEELALFVDSDINKILWLDKYEVDSLFKGGDLSEILYQAKSEKMKTNQLRIFFNDQRLDSIHILRKTSSIAAELQQKLIYLPASGYSIESRQKTSLSDVNILKVNVEFSQK